MMTDGDIGDEDGDCSAQTRTGIELLGKPPAVKQFPPPKAKRRTRLLRDPRANAGMKRTSVVEHNLYFAELAIVEETSGRNLEG